MAALTIRIEFTIPSDTVSYASKRLRKRVILWANTYNIRGHDAYTERNVFIVELIRPRDYTLFAMAWMIKDPWDHYTIRKQRGEQERGLQPKISATQKF